MNVKELKVLLDGLPDDMLVVMQKDSEGNGYSPLAGADAENVAYRADSSWSGEVGPVELTDELKDHGYTDEDLVAGVSCVVLFPVN